MATVSGRAGLPDAAPGTPPQAGALVVMGVSGCGKSSVAAACARRLGWALIEGDEHHPGANIERMRAGLPLSEDDRSGWLRKLGALLQSQPGGCVLSCSALRRSHRDLLRRHRPGLRFAHLQLDEASAHARVAARQGHPFPASLVHSQFATLEAPAGEPGVLTVNATDPIEQLAEQITAWLQAHPGE